MTDTLPTSTSDPLGALGASMGMRLVAEAPDGATVAMPVAGNTQPFGLLHGGASAALMETAASLAATLHAREIVGPAAFAVGVDLNVTHHRATRDGHVTATARALHRGRRLATYEISVEDDAGRRVASGRLTCAVVSGAADA